jgi:hypothetical protein
MQVSDFRDKNKGEITFLLGSGPSLHDVNIDIIKNYLCIAVNSSIDKYSDCDFFISDDSDIKSWNYYDVIKKSPCVKFFYEKKFKNIVSDWKNIILYDHKSWYSPENNSYYLDGLRLTKDEPIIGARISMGSALHIAYILGCNPIVLIGNDARVVDGKRYYWQFPGEKKQYRIKGRKFTRQTQQIGFDEKAYRKYWESFAEVNKDIIGKEINIIDASNSSLDCFPKMTIEEVLEKENKNE